MLVVVHCFGSCQPFDVPVVVCDAQMGKTALIWAAREGHTSTVGLLLEKGASVDQADEVRRVARVVPQQDPPLCTCLCSV